MTDVARPQSGNHERALPVGRALRLLLGLLLIAAVVPIYRRMDARFLLGTALIILAFMVAYIVLHVLVSRRVLGTWAWAGSTLALALELELPRFGRVLAA